jgi:hypothetical protein
MFLSTIAIKLARAPSATEPYAYHATFCYFLTRHSIATRVNAIGVQYFRNAMDDYWMGKVYGFYREE